MNRALGAFELVDFSNWPDQSGTKGPAATPREMLRCMEAAKRWADAEEVPVCSLDNALWLLCAQMGLYLDNSALTKLARLS